MSRPSLEYVAIIVQGPASVAAVFSNDLGLPTARLEAHGTAVPAVRAGDAALAFFAPGDPFVDGVDKTGLHHIALGREQPVLAAEQSGCALAPGDERGLNGSRQVVLAQEGTCGVQTRICEPLGLGQGMSPLVERIDHLGVASTDNALAKQVFIDRLGCEYESEQVDSEFETRLETFVSDVHGEVRHTRSCELVGSLEVTFISVGDCELEFLADRSTQRDADTARHDAAGNTRGDRSAIARYVAKRGAGLHHVALKTPDISAALGRLSAGGHRVIDRRGRPGSRRAQIGFVHPSALGGLLLHFVQRAA